MKTYEKPEITLVSLTANMAFCNSCTPGSGGGYIDGYFTVEQHCEMNEGNTDIYCKHGTFAGGPFTS